MDESVKKKIQLEISKIDTLVEKSSLMLAKCAVQEPDFYDVNAIGSILHSYYNGLESIFNLIYKSFVSTPLSGNMWHSDLFAAMFAETESHPPVLPQELFLSTKQYLGFRHVFRHSYGYELDWERLKPLFNGMVENWNAVRACFLKICQQH